MEKLSSAIRQGGSAALFELLPQRLVTAITSIAHIVKYSKGQLVHSRGDDRPGLSIVKNGSVNIGVYGVDGTFVMASMLGPGESFGEFTLFTELPRTHDVSAAEESEIYQVSSKKFLALCSQQPQILEALLKSSLVRNHILLEMLDAMRRLPLLERTAKTLLSLSYTSGSDTLIKCKQSDLAFALGVSRVTLGKVLKHLSELGLIEIAYGKIQFPDRAKLEKWLEQQSTTPLVR